MPPTDWKFDGGDPISVQPGQDGTITATVTPSNQAISGDYQLTVQASSDEKATGSVAYRVTIETPAFWGIIGIVPIVAVLGGLYWVFRTYGRR